MGKMNISHKNANIICCCVELDFFMLPGVAVETDFAILTMTAAGDSLID